LALAEEALRVIKAAVVGISNDALRALRDSTELPQATFHVLKALLHLLQKDPESFKNWKRSFEHFSLLTFSELGAYDATQVKQMFVCSFQPFHSTQGVALSGYHHLICLDVVGMMM
jgi:hypothetical protein